MHTRRDKIRRLAVVVSATFASTLPLSAADVTSTSRSFSQITWGIDTDWINTPALGGFPNNGNGGVATYDAVLASPFSTVTLDQNITIQNLTFSRGAFKGSFNLTLNDNLTWTGGAMGGTGTTSVAGLASTISGTPQLNDTPGLDRTLTNSGTMTNSRPDNQALVFGISGSGFNYVVNPGVLNNSGTFNVTAGGDFAQGNPHAGHAINNSGTWNVSGAGFTSIIDTGITFNNNGAVNVLSGTLALKGVSVNTGNLVTSSGATLNFGGGTHTLNAGSGVSGPGTVQTTGGTLNFNAGTYNVSGTTSISAGTANFNASASTASLALSGGVLSGTAVLSVGNNLTWTDGMMGGTGTTSVAGSASTISGTSPFSGNTTFGLDRTLINTGTMTYSRVDNESLAFGLASGVNPGNLNNSGTFNVTAGGNFLVINSNAGHAINNSGTWNVSGFTSTIGTGIAFNNTGVVNVTSGIMDFKGSGTSTGSFAASSGATLNFSGGSHTTNTGSSVSGAGTVKIAGGTLNFNAGTYNVSGTTSVSTGTANFNAAATTNSLALSGGTLSGTDVLSIGGNLTWTTGTMGGTGTTSVAGSASTISGTTSGGASPPGLDRTLTNTGTLTNNRADNQPIYLGYASTVNPGVFNNSGTFNVPAGGDFVTLNSNPGHAINNSGTWNVSGSGLNNLIASGIVFNNTGVVNVNSGTMILGTSTQYTGTSLTAGIWQVFGSLNLPTTGTGIVTNSAEITLSGLSSTLRAGSGSPTLESKLSTNSGTLRILAGRNFTASNPVVNGGILQIGGGFFSGSGLTNSGTGELFGFGSISPRTTNSALIRSNGGSLSFSNGIQGGGTVQIDAGSAVSVSSGTSTSSADFLIKNGTLTLGTNTFTVAVDYTNSSYGVGNSFNPRASVNGTGGILASGGIGQTLSGNVTGGGSTTPVLAFGSVRVGSTTTLT